MKADHCSFKALVSPYSLKQPIDWTQAFKRSAAVDVEIGFGMGEMLMRLAGEHPDRNFIGIEQHWERICKTIRMISQKAPATGAFENIRILRVDARVCFERLIAPKSIDTIYCLFPCPWPKKGHVKHRLFNRDFLCLLNNRLKKGGRIKIVTDFYPYLEWVLVEAKGTGFEVRTNRGLAQYDTKFERKWREEGQEEFFHIDFLKKRHLNAPVKKDVCLKNYTLKNFDFDRLQLENQTGAVSVIFKDTFFDRDKNKALVHVLVAEEHLTQHFWVAITKKKNAWGVAKVEGQNFFATPGVARALASVYEAAKKTG